jgi:hypothetical protein
MMLCLPDILLQFGQMFYDLRLSTCQPAAIAIGCNNLPFMVSYSHGIYGIGGDR